MNDLPREHHLAALRLVVALASLLGLKLETNCSCVHTPSEALCTDRCAEQRRRLNIARHEAPSPDEFGFRDVAAFGLVCHEFVRARRKHAEPYYDPHHGHSILREEFEKLWDEIKGGSAEILIRDEAAQVGAIAVRFIADLCRIGCISCADMTCEEHREQDQGGDFNLLPREWRKLMRSGGKGPALEALLNEHAELAEVRRLVGAEPGTSIAAAVRSALEAKGGGA